MKKNWIVWGILIFVAAAWAVGSYLQFPKKVTSKIRQGIESVFGVPVIIKDLSVQGKKVHIGEIDIPNPPSFVYRSLAKIRDIDLVLEPSPLLKNDWRIASLSAKIKEMHVERDTRGELNLRSLPAVELEVLADRIAKAPPAKVSIAHAEIILGKLTYGDAAAHAEPEEFNFAGEKLSFQGLNSPYVLIQQSVLKAVERIGKGSLGIRRGKLQEYMGAHLGTPRPAARGASNVNKNPNHPS